ncbi:BZ3500_MvSof-1268-A1-R1_Chr7-2g09506 [Microbotryum saponariae]|uniref:BZ3500_MvSof-1268-A1-R1_Chr7-2g09506 protein n=1 Tax=Microbotryum saponariae TaxID=289078 RepID=A0A2X0L4J7_9BASI|nr:BZ3501_MvSof-1269-A2-R1_Chr7-1g09206 [Microbotryum saponariae]SDA02589.1 BZ3500_MvSof-1268-A1-R1_Chr7-2g09506 [Microbotryum saponariae]
MEFANGFEEIEVRTRPTTQSPSKDHHEGVGTPSTLGGATAAAWMIHQSSATQPTALTTGVVDLTESPPSTTLLDGSWAWSDMAASAPGAAPSSAAPFRARNAMTTATSTLVSGVSSMSSGPLAGGRFGGDTRYSKPTPPPLTVSSEPLQPPGSSSNSDPNPSAIPNPSASHSAMDSESDSARTAAVTFGASSTAFATTPASPFVSTPSISSAANPAPGFGSFANPHPTRSLTLPSSFSPTVSSTSQASPMLASFAQVRSQSPAADNSGAFNSAALASTSTKPIVFASQLLPGHATSAFRSPALAKATSTQPTPVAGPSGSRSLPGSIPKRQGSTEKNGLGSNSRQSSSDPLQAYYRMQSASVAAARKSASDNRPTPTGRSGTYPGSSRPFVPLTAPHPSSSLNPNAGAGIDHPQQSRNGKAVANSAVASTSTSGSNTMIDLTEDDIPSDPDEMLIDDHPICIGQITSLALILYPIPELQPPAAAVDDKGRPVPAAQQLPFAQQPPPPLAVYIYRGDAQQGHETLRLVSSRRKETFGVVEHRVADVIGPLLGNGWSGAGIAPESRGKIWCEAHVMRKAERSPTLLPLVLLLFARPLDVPAISSTLERNMIYLEHPSAYNPALHSGARYSNPHNPAAGRASERRRHDFQAGIYGLSGLGATRVVSQKDEARSQVDEVFKSLKSVMELDEVEPRKFGCTGDPSLRTVADVPDHDLHTAPMVTTKLYPHQKQALSFLLDRERIHEVPEKDERGKPTILSLWSRESNPYGQPVGWKSVVADLSISGPEPPPQTRGAILADDMGLGKTIAIIALVATTLDDARKWYTAPVDRENRDARVDSLVTKAAAPPKLGIGDFSGRAYGFVEYGTPNASASTGRPLSKKKQAAAKREQKREDAIAARHNRLVTRSRATLIVCPLSTVQNWESQFEEHTGYADGRVYTVTSGLPKLESDEEDGDSGGGTDGSEEYKPRPKSERNGKKAAPAQAAAGAAEERAIKVYVYHGNHRIQDPIRLADYDVVVTTFSTLGTEYSRQSRAEDEREAEASREGSSDDMLEVFVLGPNGEHVETRAGDPIVKAGKPTKPKRKRRKPEGDGASPLQQIEWYRVVLDEAHIIKEHTTIQARAACELATPRRIALSGTPLQNSLNDLFSLVRFLRLEPFTDRSVWNQHIGSLAKVGDPLGVDRLQLIMRHLALRRTKESTDKDGKPILSLPPNKSDLVELQFSPVEHAFYQVHHQRYKHDFAKLEETDSVMKNYCSILQELLRLRQICVHPALVRDSEDAKIGGTDVVESIKQYGISRQRAIPLLLLMRDAGGGQCSECGTEMLPVAGSNDERADEVEDESRMEKKAPAKKSRKTAKASTASAAASDAEDNGGGPALPNELRSVVTRCQHLFCRLCFINHIYNDWTSPKAGDTAPCSVCKEVLKPVLDAVEIGATEFLRATEKADKGDVKPTKGGKKSAADRVFEHSTKTFALVNDLRPFSQANPASVNFRGDLYTSDEPREGESRTIGFQPHKGEVVKSVVFSQWTSYLDRLGDALSSERIKYGRLDGSMDRDARSRAMMAFKTDPACEVLLVSLRAGGVGLNLTAGRRVYLMEPFWNPAVENQAVDRIHRLGQTMPVQTVRFVIKTTIEENMRKIQKRKLDLANMSVKKTLSKAELLQQRKEELAILMS